MFVHYKKMKHNASEILLFNQKNRTLQHCSKNTVNTKKNNITYVIQRRIKKKKKIIALYKHQNDNLNS